MVKLSLIVICFTYFCYGTDPDNPGHCSDTELDQVYTDSLLQAGDAVLKLSASTQLLGKNKSITHKLPSYFDVRDKWPFCEDTMSHIRNQHRCGGSWAFAVATFLTYRHCIKSEGKSKFEFSSQDIMSCTNPKANGCEGNQVDEALLFWIKHGVVSGGDLESGNGCVPYSKESADKGKSPQCVDYCTNKNYNVLYQKDKHFGAKVFRIRNNISSIQTQIILHGPVVATFSVYEDFKCHQNYSSVYMQKWGKYIGGHAVVLMGWGWEYGRPYWLAVNSWGKNWGKMGGYFRIWKGRNHCGIEENVVTAIEYDTTLPWPWFRSKSVLPNKINKLRLSTKLSFVWITIFVNLEGIYK